MAAVQIVTPHLVVSDANAAIAFYKEALGATEALRMPAQDGKRLMHSEIHVNGARDRSWNYTVDGIDSNETSAGGSNLSPVRVNPDSLAEFRVITSNPTAEMGRNSGGQVAMMVARRPAILSAIGGRRR